MQWWGSPELCHCAIPAIEVESMPFTLVLRFIVIFSNIILGNLDLYVIN